MSEALTPSAPGTGEAVTPPEGAAPQAGSEVVVGSAGQSDEWKARFDGLMGTYNRDKDTWMKQAQQYESELASLRSKPQEENNAVADEQVLSELQQLRSIVVNQQLEIARERALAQYPEARPFADLIVGDSPDAVLSVTQQLAERVKGMVPATPAAPEATPAPPAAAPVTAPVPTAAPVVGGAVPVAGNVSVEDRVISAVKARNWGEYLSAKNAQAAELQRQLEAQPS